MIVSDQKQHTVKISLLLAKYPQAFPKKIQLSMLQSSTELSTSAEIINLAQEKICLLCFRKSSTFQELRHLFLWNLACNENKYDTKNHLFPH